MILFLKYVAIFLIGYGLGCLSPSYLFSKIKKTDLKKKGTGNLGATNTTIVLGKKYGFIVMLFDICKSIIAVSLCNIFFPDIRLAGIIAGCLCVIGHIFPFYLGFKGGKGLASFGGMILIYNPRIFVMLLLIGCIFALITDYSCCIPLFASLLFPYSVYHINRDLIETAIVTVLCLILLFKHRDNFARALTGKELTVSHFFKEFYK